MDAHFASPRHRSAGRGRSVTFLAEILTKKAAQSWVRSGRTGFAQRDEHPPTTRDRSTISTFAADRSAVGSSSRQPPRNWHCFGPAARRGADAHWPGNGLFRQSSDAGRQRALHVQVAQRLGLRDLR